MTPRELAGIYLSCFCGELPLEEMEIILAEDMQFEGPFYRFDSAREYLKSLRNNPPVDVSCNILHEYEDQASCCLIYQFTKPGIETTMAQIFEVVEDKISRITLIFDGRKFEMRQDESS